MRYKRTDTALALCASDLWPANVASQVKHMFAWAVLLRTEESVLEALPIETYEEFENFAKALYAVWPEFPMLENFSPEADWGQTKVRLDSDFVPIFYGSSIEQIPDFVEAFRISYACVDKAQIDMDFVITPTMIPHRYRAGHSPTRVLTRQCRLRPLPRTRSSTLR
ncbi:hypothetical protein [Pseudomonas sp. L13]|uniref:hypothetical protein n=1 Tax=Pseudomonas sp. L13 TaxID=343985 RepID=UPI00137B7CF4|nr:hypothetical protein [Pseudomonas sp. L13]